MADKVWKAAERAVAKFWPGARRRGPDTTAEDSSGKSDIVCSGWSIEVKHLGVVYYSAIVDAVLQSERNAAKPGDIPVAVVHKKGSFYKDSLVVMRLEKFQEFFINGCPEGVNDNDNQD